MKGVADATGTIHKGRCNRKKIPAKHSLDNNPPGRIGAHGEVAWLTRQVVKNPIH